MLGGLPLAASKTLGLLLSPLPLPIPLESTLLVHKHSYLSHILLKKKKKKEFLSPRIPCPLQLLSHFSISLDSLSERLKKLPTFSVSVYLLCLLCPILTSTHSNQAFAHTLLLEPVTYNFLDHLMVNSQASSCSSYHQYLMQFVSPSSVTCGS